MIIRFIKKQRFLILLIILLLYISQSAIAGSFFTLRFIIVILFYVAFLSIVYSISKRKLYTLIVALFATLLFLMDLISNLWGLPINSLISSFGGIAYFSFTIIIILSYIFKERLVTRDMVYGAFVVYLLLGVVWALFYSILEYISPGSFKIEDDYLNVAVGLLYSFENLNLLKSGSVKPLSAIAVYLALVQGLIAQIYMVVQVAWLVSVHFSQKRSKQSQ